MNPRREPWATPEYEERRKAHRATFKPRKDADIAAHVLAALDVGAAWWAELYLRKQWRRLEPTTRWRLRASLAPHMVGTVSPFANRQAVALLQLRDDGGPRPVKKRELRDRAQRLWDENDHWGQERLGEELGVSKGTVQRMGLKTPLARAKFAKKRTTASGSQKRGK